MGRSNKAEGLTTQAPVATEQEAAPAIADGINIGGDGNEDDLLKAIETAAGSSTTEDVSGTAEEVMPEPAARD